MALGSEPTDPAPSPALPCPICGDVMTLVRSSDADEVGPGRMEFECPKGHRVDIKLVEIDDDSNAYLTYEDEGPDPAA
jgi:hypothetical protein